MDQALSTLDSNPVDYKVRSVLAVGIIQWRQRTKLKHRVTATSTKTQQVFDEVVGVVSLKGFTKARKRHFEHLLDL